jgi:DNA-binding FadR family transcriptional regulator
MEKIRRNDEEQVAYEALVNAIHGGAPEHFRESSHRIAEHVENLLLEQGFAIVAIPPVNIN